MSATPTTLDNGETRPLVRVGGLPRVEGRGPLGALSELMRDQYAALRRWQRDYGGVFEVRLGPAPFVVAADANTAAEMLITGGQTFIRGGTMYSPMQPLFGVSMLTADGEVWRQRRRAAQPYFRQRAVAAMAERVNLTLDDVLAELEPGPCNVYRFAGRVSMAVALAVMFGQGLDPKGFDQLGTAVGYTINRIAFKWVADRLPRWMPVPGRRRYDRELAVIDRVVHHVVNSRFETGEFGDDLLGMLLHMYADGPLSREDVRNEAIALVVAGYETTANAMAWALWELSKSPEMFARVRAEADAALVDGVPRNPRALDYTVRVFKESLRMYPSGIWLPRNAVEDTELAGYPIPAGSAVLASPYLVHHDPHAWTDPERFDPERFVEGSEQPRSRHAFMPFGLGQHKCIGQHLAMLEGPLLLARMVASWDIAGIAGREPIMRISTTMDVKDGIWLQLSPRS